MNSEIPSLFHIYNKWRSNIHTQKFQCSFIFARINSFLKLLKNLHNIFKVLKATLEGLTISFY